jgi:hypothetical protein
MLGGRTLGSVLWLSAPSGGLVLQRDEACLREGVARRPRTAGGMGTDGTGAATAAATHDPHSFRGCPPPRLPSPISPKEKHPGLILGQSAASPPPNHLPLQAGNRCLSPLSAATVPANVSAESPATPPPSTLGSGSIAITDRSAQTQYASLRPLPADPFTGPDKQPPTKSPCWAADHGPEIGRVVVGLVAPLPPQAASAIAARPAARSVVADRLISGLPSARRRDYCTSTRGGSHPYLRRPTTAPPPFATGNAPAVPPEEPRPTHRRSDCIGGRAERQRASS